MPTLEEQLIIEFISDHRFELKKALVYLLANKDAPINPETLYQLYCLLDQT